MPSRRSIATLSGLVLLCLSVTSFPGAVAADEGDKKEASSKKHSDGHRVKYNYYVDNPDFEVDDDRKKSEKSGSKSKESNSEGASKKATKLDSKHLFEVISKLVKKYYPRAKLNIKKNTMHVEYKTRPYEITSSRIEKGPKWGGILLDLDLKKGPYRGADAVPKKFNEYSTFHVELYAPYSESNDCHLLTRFAYPFDVPIGFKKEFTQVVNEFENYM